LQLSDIPEIGNAAIITFEVTELIALVNTALVYSILRETICVRKLIYSGFRFSEVQTWLAQDFPSFSLFKFHPLELISYDGQDRAMTRLSGFKPS
jgi:hypothetical protein